MLLPPFLRSVDFFGPLARHLGAPLRYAARMAGQSGPENRLRYEKGVVTTHYALRLICSQISSPLIIFFLALLCTNTNYYLVSLALGSKSF